MHQVEQWKDYDKIKDQVRQLTIENNQLKMQLAGGKHLQKNSSQVSIEQKGNLTINESAIHVPLNKVQSTISLGL